MKVEFIKDRGLCVVGQVVDNMTDELAQWLIQHGFCVEVIEEEKPKGFVPFRAPNKVLKDKIKH